MSLVSQFSPSLGGRTGSLVTGREPELSGLRLAFPLIVHVDDDYGNRAFMRVLLHTWGGYRVQSFAEGEEALAFCHDTIPGLLITDLMRPRINGFELCSLIRLDVQLGHLPLLVYSACVTGAQEVAKYQADFILKPSHPQTLLDKIDKMLIKAGWAIPPRTRILSE